VSKNLKKSVYLVLFLLNCGEEIQSPDIFYPAKKDSGVTTYISQDVNYQSFCGDRMCGSFENLLNCPKDCKPNPTNRYKNFKEIFNPGWIDPFPGNLR
jgi:hypothetical protein